MIEQKQWDWDLEMPLVSGGRAILRLPVPMSEEDYDLVCKVLFETLESVKVALTTRQKVEQVDA